MLPGESPWAQSVERALQQIAGSADLEIQIAPLDARDTTASDLLSSSGAGDAPHALLCANFDTQTVALAAKAREEGYPVLFAAPEGSPTGEAVDKLDGAWFAGPADSTGDLPPAVRQLIRNAANPLLASVAYDCALIAPALAGGANELLERSVFSGGLGAFSVRPDRLTNREMTITMAKDGRIEPIARVSGLS